MLERTSLLSQVEKYCLNKVIFFFLLRTPLPHILSCVGAGMYVFNKFKMRDKLNLC